MQGNVNHRVKRCDKAGEWRGKSMGKYEKQLAGEAERTVERADASREPD